jgi:uncharacterized protein YkwD
LQTPLQSITTWAILIYVPDTLHNLNSLNQQHDHTLLVIVIIFIFLVGLFIGLNFSNLESKKTDVLLDNDQIQKPNNNFNENQVNVKSPLSNIIPTPFTKTINNEELVKFALDEINQDRHKHNLESVELGTNTAAQNHATDMFELKYFSHWNSAGVKPYVTYTQSGGRNYVQENIAVSWCEGLVCNLDPLKQIEKLEYSMMYDDAGSNWGHRNAILNPHATHVSIGLSYDSHNLYYVQHFETNLMNWQEFILSQDGILTIIGNLPKEYEINSITIFEDPKTKFVSADELKTKNPFIEKSYDQGKLVGILVEKPTALTFYQECASGKINLSSRGENQCMRYETYELQSNDDKVKITANVSSWLGDDKIKTIYVNLSNDHKDIISASSVTLNFLLGS